MRSRSRKSARIIAGRARYTPSRYTAELGSVPANTVLEPMPRMVSWASPVFCEKLTPGARPAMCSTVRSCIRAQLRPAQDSHSHGGRLHIGLAGPLRCDDNLIQEQDCERQRNAQLLSRRERSDLPQRREPAQGGGQLVRALTESLEVEPPFRIRLRDPRRRALGAQSSHQRASRPSHPAQSLRFAPMTAQMRSHPSRRRHRPLSISIHECAASFGFVAWRRRKREKQASQRLSSTSILARYEPAITAVAIEDSGANAVPELHARPVSYCPVVNSGTLDVEHFGRLIADFEESVQCEPFIGGRPARLVPKAK